GATRQRQERTYAPSRTTAWLAPGCADRWRRRMVLPPAVGCRSRCAASPPPARPSAAAQPRQHPEGPDHDDGVENDRLVLDVIEVILKFCDGIFDGGAVSFIDLRPAGQPGLDLH